MIEKVLADEKVESGWLRAWFAFEVLAGNENKAKETLEDLIDKLDKNGRVKLYKKDFSDIKKVDKPIQGVEVGYSMACDVELVANKFEDLVQVVIEYGPAASELLEPNRLNLDIAEAQSVLNNIALMMHRFAQAGIGGIVFLGKKE
ncbi:MAG: hypothetical protein KJ697_02610 [Nanoarchaeota archaeon]|nr:hypothetical protein [Nanoarchaeota archaeon]MBU4124045.1 hypothetical protein [Nanoarchaeota archaeon]